MLRRGEAGGRAIPTQTNTAIHPPRPSLRKHWAMTVGGSWMDHGEIMDCSWRVH